jgi:hypothetical protein
MNKQEIIDKIEQLKDELRHYESLAIDIECDIAELENELERQIDHENGDDIIIGDCKNEN